MSPPPSPPTHSKHSPVRNAVLTAVLRRLLLCTLVASLSACAAWRPATVPLRTIASPARCATSADTLVVMLPGAYSMPEEFEQEGFVRILRERQVASDVLLVDAHFAYYKDRSIADRLRADVLLPARQKGYRSIWLVGISLGAVGSMILADASPGELNGIVIMAPFLGERETAAQIRNAGGLAAWPAPAPEKTDVDSVLWRWLKAQTQAGASGPSTPLYLGYGTEDRFVFNQDLLSESLPADRVFKVPGGHDWSAWTPLWRRIVRALPLPRDTSCAAP